MVMFNELLTINTGATLKWVFYVLDNDNTSMPITGYEFKMQVRNSQSLDARVILDCTEYLDYTTYANTGIVILSVPHTVTAALVGNNSNAFYDLKVKDTAGEVFIVSQGKAAINGSVTAF